MLNKKTVRIFMAASLLIGIPFYFIQNYLAHRWFGSWAPAYMWFITVTSTPFLVLDVCWLIFPHKYEGFIKWSVERWSAILNRVGA